MTMRVEVTGTEELRFGDGTPVRAASAIAPFGDGWLIAQDDATHAAWLRPSGIRPVRALDPVDGHETFSSAAGTKHLKPDFEAAVDVPGGVLLLGSGSAPARMRASLVTAGGATGAPAVADLTPLHLRVARVLGLRPEQLNLEGACRIGDRLRWFQRGNSAAGVPSASVDVDLPALLAALTPPAAPPDCNAAAGSATGPGAAAVERVAVGGLRRYELGAVRGVALAVTDAVALPDGRVLVSAAAEDTPNAIDDGPVVGAALALLDGARVVAVAALPEGDDGPYKVEGLALRSAGAGGVALIAVVDADDPGVASRRLDLSVRL